MLYVIDPYGVAAYIQLYAAYYSQNIAEYTDSNNTYNESMTKREIRATVEYKDRIFELLYNRSPYYYFRDLDSNWYVTDKSYDIKTIVSESETLFGMHPLYDLTTSIDIVNIVCSTLGIVFGTPATPEIVNKIVDIIVNTVAIGPAFVSGELANYLEDVTVGQIMGHFDLGWACSYVSLCSTLQEIAHQMSSAPTCYAGIINYCVENVGYKVYLKLHNGELVDFDDLKLEL